MYIVLCLNKFDNENFDGDKYEKFLNNFWKKSFGILYVMKEVNKCIVL